MNQNVNIGKSVHFLPFEKLWRKPNYTQKVTLYLWNLIRLRNWKILMANVNKL